MAACVEHRCEKQLCEVVSIQQQQTGFTPLLQSQNYARNNVRKFPGTWFNRPLTKSHSNQRCDTFASAAVSPRAENIDSCIPEPTVGAALSCVTALRVTDQRV